MELDHSDIRAILPHGHPLVLVDSVVSLEPGANIVGTKAITGTDACYRDIPANLAREYHAYPVSLVMESFGQTGALLWLKSNCTLATDSEHILMLAVARDCRIEGSAYPGDVMTHRVRLSNVVGDNVFIEGETWVGDRRIAVIGSMLAVIRLRSAILSRGLRMASSKEQKSMSKVSDKLEELRVIVAEVLERDPGEIENNSDFVETYDADSLRAVEILARIEKKYKVEIPQGELPLMRNLQSVYDVVARHAGWQG
jgi:3-hydroxyacyl-[acyl-carrier-protein] dehydratase